MCPDIICIKQFRSDKGRQLCIQAGTQDHIGMWVNKQDACGKVVISESDRVDQV